MKNADDYIEQLEKDLHASLSAINTEVKSIEISEWLFHNMLSKPDFELAEEDTWEDRNEEDGYYFGVDVCENPHLNGSDEKYRIHEGTLWEICPDCLNNKMYDEKNEVHYCPMCDNRRTRFKDKLFNVLR